MVRSEYSCQATPARGGILEKGVGFRSFSIQHLKKRLMFEKNRPSGHTDLRSLLLWPTQNNVRLLKRDQHLRQSLQSHQWLLRLPRRLQHIPRWPLHANSSTTSVKSPKAFLIFLPLLLYNNPSLLHHPPPQEQHPNNQNIYHHLKAQVAAPAIGREDFQWSFLRGKR